MTDRDYDKFYIPTGIPVVFDEETKEMIPFLLQVYSDSIIWEDKFSDSPAEAYINDAGVLNEDITNVTYTPYKQFKLNGWDVHVLDGYRYTATRSFSIGKNFNIADELFKQLTFTAKLPFPIAIDSRAKISLTLNAENDNLAASCVSFSKSENEFKLFNEIIIKLYNTISSFHQDFSEIDTYINSRIYIEVAGSMEIEDQSNIDLGEGYTNINTLPDYAIQPSAPDDESTWIEPVDD